MNRNQGQSKAGRSRASNDVAGSNAAVAHQLVELGISVFPVSAEKRPLTPRGFHDAARDATPWARAPSLVGIPTSFFWVLDLDPPLETSVQLLCALLRCQWRDLTDVCGCIVCTPRAGFHLYWKRSLGVAIRTAAGDIGTGIDTRGHDGDGRATGYVVAPGCVLPDGRQYAIERGGLDELTEAALPLLHLAAFSRRERARIAADAGLGARLAAADPSDWRRHWADYEASQRKLGCTIVATGEPMRRQALHDLDTEQQQLAQLEDGRRQAVFSAAARLARYVAHGMLSRGEVEAGLIEAWHASGAASKHGLTYPRGAIQRACDLGRSDPLPPLMRRFRSLPGADE